MTPEEQKEILAHSRAIAKILYKNTKAEELTSLGKIEAAVFYCSIIPRKYTFD